MGSKYQGRRFALAVLCCVLLTGAFVYAGSTPEEATKFGSFALYLAGIFGAYCTGQSATDYIKAKNGHGG